MSTLSSRPSPRPPRSSGSHQLASPVSRNLSYTSSGLSASLSVRASPAPSSSLTNRRTVFRSSGLIGPTTSLGERPLDEVLDVEGVDLLVGLVGHRLVRLLRRRSVPAEHPVHQMDR